MERPSNKQTNPFKLCNSQPEENREVDGVYAHGESSEMYALEGGGLKLQCNSHNLYLHLISYTGNSIKVTNLAIASEILGEIRLIHLQFMDVIRRHLVLDRNVLQIGTSLIISHLTQYIL